MLETYQLAAYDESRALLEDFSAFTIACAWSHNEHGPADLIATIEMTREAAYAWRARPSFILLVHDLVTARVWAGRVLPDDIAINPGGESVTITAYGFWTALADTLHTSLWSSTSVAAWRPVTSEDRPEYNADMYQFDTYNRLWMTLVKGTTYAGLSTDRAGMTFEVPAWFGPDYLARSIRGVQFTYEAVLPANWQAHLVFDSFEFSSANLAWQLHGAGLGTTLSGTHTVTTAATKMRATFRLDPDTAYTNAAENGAYYLKITGLRVFTADEGHIYAVFTAGFAAGLRTVTPDNMTNITAGQVLTIGLSDPLEQVTVISTTSTTFDAVFANAHTTSDRVMGFTALHAGEMVRALLDENRTINGGQLAATHGWIDDPDLDILDFAYEDRPATDILTQLAGLGDSELRRWVVGVNERQQVFFHVRGEGARDWYVNSDDLAISGAGNERATRVYALYQDPAGRTLRTDAETDAQAVAALGLVRMAAIPASTAGGPGSSARVSAEAQRDLVLADRKDARPQASVSIRLLEGRTGTLWPILSIRPGDTVTIRDLPPTLTTTIDRLRTFTVAEVHYDAFVPDVVTVVPEEPMPFLDVLLAQQAVRRA